MERWWWCLLRSYPRASGGRKLINGPIDRIYYLIISFPHRAPARVQTQTCSHIAAALPRRSTKQPTSLSRVPQGAYAHVERPGVIDTFFRRADEFYDAVNDDSVKKGNIIFSVHL